MLVSDRCRRRKRMQIGFHPSGFIDSLPRVPRVSRGRKRVTCCRGWYGAGAGLAAARKRFGFERVRAAYMGGSSCCNLIDDVEAMQAAPIWYRQRVQRARAGAAVFCDSGENMPRRSISATLKGRKELLDSDGTLQRAIRLRNRTLIR